MRRLGIMSLVALVVGCPDTPVEYIEPEVSVPEVDDELTITGSFCASPAADVAFPVKVMFLVDGSGSQQFSDQNRQRVVAVEETINALMGTPAVEFKIIVFNASVSAVPSPDDPTVFTNAVDDLVEGMANLAEADAVTDYQGALSMAYSELRRDIDLTLFSNGGRTRLARTKYVIIFISDGFPDPQCQAGLFNDFDPNFDATSCPPFPAQTNCLCEDTSYLRCQAVAGSCANGSLCRQAGAAYDNPAAVPCSDGSGCQDQTTCAFDPAVGTMICQNGTRTCYGVNNPSTFLAGIGISQFAAGADYNQPYQILRRVSEIMELEEDFDVGEIRLHAGLVLDPDADPAILAIFGDPAEAVPLMQEAAELGRGNYMEFYGGEQIDFLSIDYDTIKQPRVVRSFFADNRAARQSVSGLVPDSDFDGLADAAETPANTFSRRADSDGDGFSDFFEVERRGFGFDARDPCVPAILASDLTPGPCIPASPNNCNYYDLGFGRREYKDDDQDGLHDCEEEQIGTNPATADTDHDSILDPLELIYGTDPLLWDYERDDDQDGVPNGREIEWHLHPLIQQTDSGTRDRYRYDRPQVSTTVDGRACYDFAVRRLRLASTLDNEDPLVENPPLSGTRIPLDGVGHNEIRLYIVENMADDLAGEPLIRTACVRARYIAGAVKVPADGQVVLTESDFHYTESDDPTFDDPAVVPFSPITDCINLQ
jgi:hypothetical protein